MASNSTNNASNSSKDLPQLEVGAAIDGNSSR